MSSPSPRPELTALALGDPPPLWQALGFALEESLLWIGGVCLRLGAAGRGIVAWSLPEVDGLPTMPAPASRPEADARLDGDKTPERAPHPNGAIGIDHVVVATPDFDRTAAALAAAGMPLRRQLERLDGARMGFRRLGPAILELVEAPPGRHPGPAVFWGLVVVVENLEALAERLGDRLGPVKDAVQPGRRIATLRDSAGLGEAVAFMDPEPAP